MKLRKSIETCYSSYLTLEVPTPQNCQTQNCLSAFDLFVVLALKELSSESEKGSGRGVKL